MTVIFFIMFFLVPSYIIGQTPFTRQTSLIEKKSFSNKQSVSQKKSPAEERIPFRVMSWNAESLFGTRRDTLKNDNGFLPDATCYWNYIKYKKKLVDMARIVIAVGEWNPLALVGLYEVENDSALRDLVQRPPLKELGYRYVMTGSPGLRGIDVALLYQRDLFKLLLFRSIPIPSFKHHRPTRSLLHVSGLLLTEDTFDVVVCHLPPRSGGAKESKSYRLYAVRILRTEAGNLLNIRLHPQLVIMGDFNDYPINKSIEEILEATVPKHSVTFPNPRKLYHPLARRTTPCHFGSYKYHGEWGLFDHLIISGNLLDASSKFFTGEDKANAARLPSLLTEDRKYGDDEPLRTYKGVKYQGEISDHLFIYVDFELIIYQPKEFFILINEV